MARPRLLTGLTVLAIGLAGCAAPGTGDVAADPPQFVEPTPAITTVPSPAESPAATPPSSPSSSPSTSPTPSKQPSRTPEKKKAVKRVFPVQASNVDWHPTHSKYPGTDLFADCGEKIVAVTDGVILEVSTKDVYVKGRPDGPNNGGLSVSLLGDDGVRYYGSHFSEIQSGIRAGVRVTAGQKLGEVGRTGNANNVCHVHFGISPPCAETGDWKVRRGVVWPAPYLDSWRAKGNKSPVAEVQKWARDNDCRA